MGNEEKRPVRVRDGRLEDLDDLVAFNAALALETESTQLDAERLEAGVRALLSDPSRGRYFIAESDDGRVLGCTMITTEWSDWRNGQLWWFQSVYIRPDSRRRGVFRLLYDHVTERAEADPDVIGLRLYVHEENRPALVTYEQMGMTPTEYRVFERIFD